MRELVRLSRFGAAGQLEDYVDYYNDRESFRSVEKLYISVERFTSDPDWQTPGCSFTLEIVGAK